MLHLHCKACTTAALNYIDVAKGIASIYSSGMPQAVELLRLHVERGSRAETEALSLSLRRQGIAFSLSLLRLVRLNLPQKDRKVGESS